MNEEIMKLSNNKEEWKSLVPFLVSPEKISAFEQLINNKDATIMKATIEYMCGLKDGKSKKDIEYILFSQRYDFGGYPNEIIGLIKEYMQGGFEYMMQVQKGEEPVGWFKKSYTDEEIRSLAQNYMDDPSLFETYYDPFSGEIELGTKEDFVNALLIVAALKEGASFEDADDLIMFAPNKKNVRSFVAEFYPGVGQEYADIMNELTSEENYSRK